MIRSVSLLKKKKIIVILLTNACETTCASINYKYYQARLQYRL